LSVLHGLDAPAGEGKVIEVHLDMIDANTAFLGRLNDLGFENDPFLDFYPPEFRFHYTGRTRAHANEIHSKLSILGKLIDEVIEAARKAGVRMYVESELVRDIRHFDNHGSMRGLSALEGIYFRECGPGCLTKADVHVEFRAGTVPDDVRSLLLEKGFYWVSTPISERFPCEEIATLQASIFLDAQHVYDRLVAAPLPACTGIHLEQKLAMIPSHPDLPMPGAMEMVSHAMCKVG